jgi:hypothetical protein
LAGNSGLAGSDTGCVLDRHAAIADRAGNVRHADTGAQIHIICQAGERDEDYTAVAVANAG